MNTTTVTILGGLLLVGGATGAAGQVYKWIDENGRITMPQWLDEAAAPRRCRTVPSSATDA